MDETTLAFEAPIMRSVATGKGDPLDRISVREHVRKVEIGAFHAERGITQRIRFNVVLEVSRSTAALEDDVDKVISYETIVEAIDHILGTERINLLETLAERVAERCLDDRRAVRVFVRIEKLDHISGTLGVEIVRTRKEIQPQIAPVGTTSPQPDIQPRPRVLFIGNDVLSRPILVEWIDAVVASKVPTIICLEPRDPAQTAGAGQAARQIALLSIEQNAWVLAGLDRRCVVVGSRAELDWAMKHQQVATWAPSKIVNDAVKAPDADASDPAGLALWLAVEFNACEFVSLGAELDISSTEMACRFLDPSRPEALSAQA